MRRPVPPSASGWYLGTAGEDVVAIETGELTAMKALKISMWFLKWSRWVAWKEKQMKKSVKS